MSHLTNPGTPVDLERLDRRTRQLVLEIATSSKVGAEFVIVKRRPSSRETLGK